jgi:hypothetical protein
MALSQKEIKERHWNKKLRNAPVVDCSCGCGKTMKSIDNYGRKKNIYQWTQWS